MPPEKVEAEPFFLDKNAPDANLLPTNIHLHKPSMNCSSLQRFSSSFCNVKEAGSSNVKEAGRRENAQGKRFKEEEFYTFKDVVENLIPRIAFRTSRWPGLRGGIGLILPFLLIESIWTYLVWRKRTSTIHTNSFTKMKADGWKTQTKPFPTQDLGDLECGPSNTRENNKMEATDAKDVNKDCKRKFSEVVNSDSNAVTEKPTKAIHFMQPKGKASYNNSLTEHRHRLADLLSKLLREHNWKEASGVLSMLMKGTSYRNFSMLTHKKYLAALEILSRSGDTHLNPIKIKHIHDIWTSKHAGGKAVTKKRYLIQLGFALYSLTQRDIEEALDAIKFLSQAPESRLDPFVNMLAGLIFYQLWYSGIPEEMQLRNSDIHMASDANGTDSNDVPYVKPEQDDCLNDHSSVAMQDVKFPVQSDIVKSKANRPSEQCHHESSTSEFSMKPSAEMFEDEASSFNHDNNFIDASVSFPYDLDASLLPIRVGQTTLDMYSAYLQRETSKEHHANAVKHLQQALHSSPPVSAALLPLIQLLLLVDQVDEALKELEDFCQSSNSVLPFRLRACLLECVGERQPTVLSTSYEDILKKDPTCSHSLAELIRLYKNGNYNVESLLEMIALHLDATYGLAGTWGELASCFLGLQTTLNSGYEEDCMSTVQHTNDTVGKPACSTSFNLIHPMFMKSEARKSWRLRCRWWSSRHFSKDKYLSEVQAGDWELLTFKAACASHLYEPKFEYADKVLSGLKENEDGERCLFLQMHFQKSLKLHVNLNRER